MLVYKYVTSKRDSPDLKPVPFSFIKLQISEFFPLVIYVFWTFRTPRLLLKLSNIGCLLGSVG